MSANVNDAPLGCVFGWRLRLRRKLKHGCLLALNQACQENTRAIGKFECVMMHLWHHNEAFGAALAKNIRKMDGLLSPKIIRLRDRQLSDRSENVGTVLFLWAQDHGLRARLVPDRRTFRPY